MTGEEDGERSCAFTILVFLELPLHRGPLFPRHPPYSVFKSIWDGKSSHSRERGTAGRVVHRKEAVLVLRKVEIASWFNSKKKKKHILKTQSNPTKAPATGEGECSSLKELSIRERRQLTGQRWNCRIPAALKHRLQETPTGNTQGFGDLFSKKWVHFQSCIENFFCTIM